VRLPVDDAALVTPDRISAVRREDKVGRAEAGTPCSRSCDHPAAYPRRLAAQHASETLASALIFRRASETLALPFA
jgi:hypothetical protein